MDPSHARAFAIDAHGSQRYGDRPYSVHLDAVAEIAAPFGEAAQVLAYLHDVVEDTAVELEQIREMFGDLAADCVALLTDAPGPDRKARKALTYARLAEVSGACELALVVKTADRLANVRACVADGRVALWTTYRDEHASFRAAAWRNGLCDALWQELDSLLEEWTDSAST